MAVGRIELPTYAFLNDFHESIALPTELHSLKIITFERFLKVRLIKAGFFYFKWL